MIVRETTQCRLCAATDLHLVFDLGEQALAGRFPTANEPDAPKAPLEIVKCSQCHLVQLGHEVELEEMYGRTYGYRSGINVTMSAHLAGIVEQVQRLAQLKAGDTVLDIASNDATLLNSYTVDGLSRVGIDPTIAQYHAYYPEDIAKAAEFFSAETFNRLSPTSPAKAITSIAMFYDLPDPNRFAADIKSVLSPDGMWVLEQSDLGMMLEAYSFDTICHEHLEYYGFRQIEQILSNNGLKAFDVQFNDINGGSACVFVCHVDGPYPEQAENLNAARRREATLQLDQMSTYAAFRQHSEAVRDELATFLKTEKSQGRRIHIYGASTKGNVLLQYCGIDNQLVDAAAERNPAKYGSRTPGTNIPIISEEDSRSQKPDYYLVLPWHFQEEFIQRESAYIASGGRLIFPLPRFRIVDASTVQG